ncbi:unnamed protein product [Porites evermanni]|uniref:Protein kinase domain-containing protein n=1 Tax=Porites evermanni TaxID=104178 RepID=A0ABN8SAG3_9CNID|nr:unnamed protein product [Porites evermanni]
MEQHFQLKRQPLRFFFIGSWLCFTFLASSAAASPSNSSNAASSSAAVSSTSRVVLRSTTVSSNYAISPSASGLAASQSTSPILSTTSVPQPSNTPPGVGISSVTASQSSVVIETSSPAFPQNSNNTAVNGTDSPTVDEASSRDLWRTVGIAVGVSSGYLLLVAGLSFYVEWRRSKRPSKKSEVKKVSVSPASANVNAAFTGDVEEQVANGHVVDGTNMVMKEKQNGVLTSHTDYDNMKFPRHDLELIKILGNGAYGRAYLVLATGIRDCEDKTTVVVKSLLSDDENVREEFNYEMNALRGLQHKNVITLLGFCNEVEPIYLIFESVNKGDLKQLLLACQNNNQTTLNLNQKLAICEQVASGMTYLSSQNFVHKDLAARNCLVAEDLQVKISFLKLSSDVYSAEYHSLNNVKVPLRWMPPEAIFDNNFSEKSDVWSYGVLVWEIYSSGKMPYNDLSNDEVLKCARYGLRLTNPDNCPASVSRAVQKCWEANPLERPTFSELLVVINSAGMDTHL